MCKINIKDFYDLGEIFKLLVRIFDHGGLFNFNIRLAF